MRTGFLVDLIEKGVGQCGKPVRLKAVIEEQLISQCQLSKIAAAEEAERKEDVVARAISARCVDAETAGLLPVICLTGTLQAQVCGYSLSLPTDTEAISNIKRQRLNVDKILEKICRLSFSEFELFGKKLLLELGAARACVTAHSNDQGIDFFGELSLGQYTDLPPTFLKLAHDVKLLFVGQAKHYPNRALSTSVVRELIGSVSLAKTKTFSGDGIDLFKDLEVRPFSPVVVLLISTGSISAGALHLAKSSGIIARSGRQLAVFLADRGIGTLRANADNTFDENAFSNWLHGVQ